MKILNMNSFYLIIIFLFSFIILLAGQIFKLQKEVRKLNKIVKHLLIKDNNGK